MIAEKVNFSSPAINTVHYKHFKGVDASTDPMLIDRNRLAVGLNLISDYGGMPERRLGYRTLKKFEGGINGIFHCFFDAGNILLIHAGENIYRLNPETYESELLKAGIGNHRSTGFWFNGKQYILTGSEYLVFDGESVKSVSEVAFVPTVYIGKAPDGSKMTPLYDINLLSSKWAEEFIGDGTAKIYQLAYDDLDSKELKIEQQTALDVWVTYNKPFTVDRTVGKVTFTTAPPAPPVVGMSNIRITASRNFEGYGDKIKKGLVCSVFEDSTIFIAGSEKGKDYHSGYRDPTYFSDLAFDEVGTNATDIMCYLKLGEQQLIVKEDNNQDATIYLRSKIIDDGAVSFITTQGAVGVGAISRYAHGNLRDDVLFLSRQGVFAVASSRITLERTLQNRSYFIDALLTREKNLDNAVSIVWEGYFIISNNGRCYVLDGKQSKSYLTQSGGDFIYECYHWDNIYANCFLELGGDLFFGTPEGQFCRFNNDVVGMTKYSDNGSAIVVKMVTKMDDMGSPQLLKTLQKKGSGVTAKPAVRCSVKIYLRSNYDPEPQFVKMGYKDIFDWSDIDFNRISFNANDNPSTEYFRKKVKKFKALQLVLVADQPNEAFGVYNVIYCFTKGNYAKK